MRLTNDVFSSRGVQLHVARAAAIRAPSHLLTAARAAANAGRDASTGRPRPAAPEPAFAGQPECPPVQDILHGLGVTSPDLLQRAATLTGPAGSSSSKEPNAAGTKNHPAPQHQTDQPAAQRSSTTATPPATRTRPAARTTQHPTTSTNPRKQNTDHGHQRRFARRVHLELENWIAPAPQTVPCSRRSESTASADARTSL